MAFSRPRLLSADESGSASARLGSILRVFGVLRAPGFVARVELGSRRWEPLGGSSADADLYVVPAGVGQSRVSGD